MSPKGIQIVHCRDAIPLPLAVARHLLSIAEEAWDHVLMILPTMETGRRVVDALLQSTEGKVIFPPRFSTPLTLVPFGEGEGVATPMQARLAWSRVLHDARDCRLTFGKHSSELAREVMADSFVALIRDLAAANYNIPNASILLGKEDSRWGEWVRLWEKYIELLGQANLQCPAEAQLTAVRAFTPEKGISRVIAAGVYDMPPLAWEAFRHCAVQLLIYAPGLRESDAAFDERGRARPEFWMHRMMPVPQEDTRIVASFDVLAQEATAIATQTSKRIAIISGDADLSSEIAFAFEEQERKTFSPEGKPLNRHPVIRLAILLTKLATNPNWENLDALLRHPDFLDSIEREKIWHRDELSQWNAAGAHALRPDLKNIMPRLEKSNLEGRTLGQKPFAKSLLPIIKKFQHLSHQLSASDAASALREILLNIYGLRDMAKRPGDKEAIKALVRVIDEISTCESFVKINASALGLILMSLPGMWTPEKDPTAVEIEGWLELSGEDAEMIIIAGLNEGLLPAKRRIDPLLPDAARGLLGLDNAVSRHARDAAMLHAAIISRKKGDVKFFSALKTPDGSPLKPSRLLLRVPDKDLPSRVLDLCPETTDQPFALSGHIFEQAPLQIPVPTAPIYSMRVTDFASYLACPLRFYLAKRLGMRAPHPIEHNLQAAGFGTWIHEVLRRFASDPVARESANEDVIREFVISLWDSFFIEFADDVDLLLQREAGRMRLEQFAAQQAISRAEGWEIKLAEWPMETNGADALRIPGWPLALRGRIDRVDVRGDSLRLIEYKTGHFSTAKIKDLPRSNHLTKFRKPSKYSVKPDFARFGEEVWFDLQLPLYSTAIQHARPFDIPSDIRLSYFLLPDEVGNTSIYDWIATREEMESATACARAIMEEVASDVVLARIAKRDFQSFAVDLQRDDFEELALSQFIESGALEVER